MWFWENGSGRFGAYYFAAFGSSHVFGLVLWRWTGIVSRGLCARFMFVWLTLLCLTLGYGSGDKCTAVFLNYTGMVSIVVVFTTITSVKFSFAVSLGLILPALIVFQCGFHSAGPLYDIERMMDEFKFITYSVILFLTILRFADEIDAANVHALLAKTFTMQAEEKDRFMTSFSHDLRTPLNGIFAAVELLSWDGSNLTAEQGENVKVLVSLKSV